MLVVLGIRARVHVFEELEEPDRFHQGFEALLLANYGMCVLLRAGTTERRASRRKEASEFNEPWVIEVYCRIMLWQPPIRQLVEHAFHVVAASQERSSDAVRSW